MSKELKFWQFVHSHQQAGRKIALLWVLESKGSSPGRAGFKLALSQSGEMCGSIGGGIMEVKLTEWAKSLLKKGDFSPIVKKQIHHKKAGKNQSGMICSGEQTLAIICLSDSYIQIIRSLIERLSQNKPIALIATSANRQLTLETEYQESAASPITFRQYTEHNFYYKEQLGAAHTLYIIGGGHCALALSALMARLGFYIIVIDDRPEVNTLQQNTFAHQKYIVDNYTHIEPLIQTGSSVYVVIMTLGYAGDLIALRQVVHLSFNYLGMLGSKAKVREIMANLRAEGIPEALISRIHAPIGLPIHSHTPEEIAVSIAAEIIAIKNSP